MDIIKEIFQEDTSTPHIHYTAYYITINSFNYIQRFYKRTGVQRGQFLFN